VGQIKPPNWASSEYRNQAGDGHAERGADSARVGREEAMKDFGEYNNSNF
jgi:hypothetical protein